MVTMTIKESTKSGDVNQAGGVCVMNQQSQLEGDDRTQVCHSLVSRPLSAFQCYGLKNERATLKSWEWAWG